MADRSLQFLRNVPPALKKRLAREARKRGSNMNAIAVEILAEAHGLSAEVEVPRKTSPSPNGTDMMLRIASAELRQALKVAAFDHDWSVPREIIWTLCGHYSLAAPEEPPVAAPAAA